jgi:ElaB/YqjD/DUF883 family membrane-anchored ribosome-binding protein
MFNGQQNSTNLLSDENQKSVLEALNLLDRTATSKGRELKETIRGSFKNLRSVFDQIEERSSELEQKVEHKGSQMKAAFVKGTTTAISQINRQYSARPWIFLGSTAMLGVCVGYVMAKRMRSTR